MRGVVRLSLVASLFDAGFYLATALIVLYFSELGMSELLIGVVITLARLSYGLASMFSGAMADRIGRCYPMMVGFLMGAASMLLFSILKTRLLAAILLIVAWVSYSLYSPAALALVSDLSEGSASSYSWYYLIVMVGQIVGQSLSGSMVKLGGYPLAFIAGSMLASTSAALTWIWFRGEKRGEARISLLRDFTRGVSILARNRYLGCLAISLALHGIGFALSYTFIPLVAKLDQRMGEPEIGFALSLLSLGNLVATVPLGKATDKMGGREMLVYHLAASSAVWWIYPLLRSKLLVYALMIAQGIIAAMDLPARRHLLVTISEREVATAIGSLDSITFFSSSLGSFLAGYTWNLGHWVPFTLGSIVNTVGLLLLIKTKPQQRVEENE